jgi:two-component system response regulator YesN
MFGVVIIDDEYVIREGIRKTIDWDTLGCEIVGEAEDGEEGLEIIRHKKPDIIITDIRMPGIDGLDMIKKIKDLKDDCRIIIITGFRDFAYAQEAVHLGAFRFLLKPTKNSELMEAVNEAKYEIQKDREEKEYYGHLEKQIKQYYGISDNSNYEGQENEYQSLYISKAIEYMQENYHKNLTLQEVADHLYVSTWHLSKLFKKYTGSNFVDVLNSIRLGEAKKLLKDPRYRVYEVANAVGFTDVAYFSRLFKKNIGLTPGEYKNK